MRLDPLPHLRRPRKPTFRRYGFEIFECFRKLALVGAPVFFSPQGSASQLIFGLLVCFLTFGGYMLYAPYVDAKDDRLAQICQVQPGPS
jgi:hypothetical protein